MRFEVALKVLQLNDQMSMMRWKEARVYLASGLPFILIQKVSKCDRISRLAQNVVMLIGLGGRQWLHILKSKLEAPSLVRPRLRPTALPELWVLRVRLRNPVEDSSASDFQANLEAESRVLVCARIEPLSMTMFKLALFRSQTNIIWATLARTICVVLLSVVPVSLIARA